MSGQKIKFPESLLGDKGPQLSGAPLPLVSAKRGFSTAEEALQAIWGYESFRKPQGDIVQHVMTGGDAFVLMPTGGGKSLCYQVPAMVLEGMTIVVSPIISLMKDQVDALRRVGVRAAWLSSDMEQDERNALEGMIREGSMDLLYVAPERLQSNSFMNLIENVRIGLLAVDEVHCVSEWGHSFREDYLKVGDFLKRFPSVPKIALTATATPTTEEDIVRRLGMEGARRFRSSFDRPNIRYEIVEKTDASQQLLDFINHRHLGQTGVVYCNSQKTVETIARFLHRQGIKAYPYHRDLPKHIKTRHQDIFTREEGVVIVATIAFGMGIDKANVRFVVHYDMPSSLESYYQETGRAGRDGLDSEALLLCSMKDYTKRLRLISREDENEEPDETDLKRSQFNRIRLNAVMGLIEAAECRRSVVLRYFGEEHPGDCGNCDRCLNPIETYDAREEAKLAIRVVNRTNERYGMSHIISILLGQQTLQVEEAEHHKLLDFGAGSYHDKRKWRSIFRQLCASGYLRVDSDTWGGLALTPKGWNVLLGKEHVRLVNYGRGLNVVSAYKIDPKKGEGLPPSRTTLWEALRHLRYQIASEKSVPPFTILPDSVLSEMVSSIPETPEAMQALMDEDRFAVYGERFLDIIRDHQRGLEKQETEVGGFKVKFL